MDRTDTATLEAMLSTAPECEIGHTCCEGTATERDIHPTGAALGEDWLVVWYCLPCAWQAARGS
ncbi:hypothetical protein ABR737_01560 [Streptomyces sp. Edi2]|uniref:hypothetical protein n=1 Tax=Streptomyces sp. Edi2 TaxID=3162528 RepID=UPI0033058B48